ncbi:hypothetical protein BGX27_010191 [Mortierella sp. AM989]|nr:hypothetical protein BGX27_010191 [Mortierella sp. AM989]
MSSPNSNSAGSNTDDGESGSDFAHGPPAQPHYQPLVTPENRSPASSSSRSNAPEDHAWYRTSDDDSDDEYEEEEEAEQVAAHIQTPGEGLWAGESTQTLHPHVTSGDDNDSVFGYQHGLNPDLNYFNDCRDNNSSDNQHQHNRTLDGTHGDSLTHKRSSQKIDHRPPFATLCVSVPSDNVASSQSPSALLAHLHSLSTAHDDTGLSRPALNTGLSSLQPFSLQGSAASAANQVMSQHTRSPSSPSASRNSSQAYRQAPRHVDRASHPAFLPQSRYPQLQQSRIPRINDYYFTPIHPLDMPLAPSPQSPSSYLNSPHQSHAPPYLTLPSGDLFEGMPPTRGHNIFVESVEQNQGGGSSGPRSFMADSSYTTRGWERQSTQGESTNTVYQMPIQNGSRRSVLISPIEFPAQSEIDFNMHSNPRRETSDSSDDLGIVMLPRETARMSVHRPTFRSSREEESDIERYSGLMKKTATQNTLNEKESAGQSSSNHQRYTNFGNDLEKGSNFATQQSNKPQSNEKSRVTLQEQDAGVSSAQTTFNFRSIKSNILSRLFGSQPISAGESNSFNIANPSLANNSNKGKTPVSSENSLPQPPLPGPRITRHPSHEEQTEDLMRNITTNRVLPTRSGGILSNLLKLQALSMPPPSRNQRRRRTKPHHRRTRASRNGSFASDIAPANSNRFMLSGRKASVISLPGLLMTAPTAIGLRSNLTSPSTAVQSPESSTTFLNAPMTDNAPRISTSVSCPDGFRSVDGEYPNFIPPTTTKEMNLSPERLGGSSQYLQTHSACSTRSSVSVDDGTSTYSSVSHDPILSAIRLNQRMELTEAVAEILQRQDLLIRLCKSFIRYGAPSHRIEQAMDAMCKTFEIDGSFAFLPGLMMISFGDSDTHTSETHLIKCAQGFEMGRLAQVHRIARALVNGDMEPEEGLATLKAVNNQKPLYNMWIMLASFAILSGLIAPLVFKGSWHDMLAGTGLGGVVGLTTLMASQYSVYSSVFEVSTSILVAFVAKSLRDYVCFTSVVLSAIVMLLPGLSLTTAIMELSSRYMISGSVRMFYSLMYCLFLGFGISIGSNLWDAIREPPPGDMKIGYCHPATEPWRWILFPLMGISISIQLHASPRQWPVMVICSSVGYAVSELAGLYWPHSAHIAAAVSAFVVGLLGNIYERITHELAFVPILGAILLIVPGGMGVRSTLLLLDESGNSGQGTLFALHMILVALGIAVGLFASTLVVYPLGKRRNALLTF